MEIYLISVGERLKHKLNKSSGVRRILKIQIESFAFIMEIVEIANLKLSSLSY